MYFVAGPNKSLDFIFMWKYEQRQQWRRFPSNFMFSYGFWSSKLPYHLNTENESFHLARLMVDLLDIEEGGSDTTTTTRRFLVPASWPSPHENVQQHPNSAILTYWVSQVKAVYGLIFELFFSFFDCCEPELCWRMKLFSKHFYKFYPHWIYQLTRDFHFCCCPTVIRDSRVSEMKKEKRK